MLDELTSKISTLNLERARRLKSKLVALTRRVQKVLLYHYPYRWLVKFSSSVKEKREKLNVGVGLVKVVVDLWYNLYQ